MSTPTKMHPLFAAMLRAAPLKPAAAAAPATRHKSKAAPAPAKPKAMAKPTPTVHAAVSHAASANVIAGNFSHLLDARSLIPPEPPAASSGTRRPALTREQSAALAKRIIAANNRRLGVTTDADNAQARAQAEADLTPTAKRILSAARRAGLAW